MTRRFLAAAAATICLYGIVQTGALAETATERGSYLVNTIMACGNCHTPRDPAGKLIPEKQLSGGIYFTAPPFIATAANITPDPETGIGSWSDDDIKRALTQGVRPNHGRLAEVPLAAVMPANFYKALVPRDLDAVVAYLRSVKPVKNEVPKPVYKAPVHREPYPDAEQGFDPSKLSDPLINGRYLATIGHCMECHAAWSRGVSDFKNGLGRGGRPFGPDLVHGLDPAWQGSVAANITSDPVDGIGKLTDEQIIRAIRQGIAHDGHKIKPPMAVSFYAGLTDRDVHDIVAYLRTLPPLK
jgi:mono/diheme cytochrome c family protein